MKDDEIVENGTERAEGDDPILGGVRRLLEEYVESGDMAEDFAKLGETPMARLSFADRLMNYTTPKRKAVDVSGEIAVENEMSDVLRRLLGEG